MGVMMPITVFNDEGKKRYVFDKTKSGAISGGSLGGLAGAGLGALSKNKYAPLIGGAIGALGGGVGGGSFSRSKAKKDADRGFTTSLRTFVKAPPNKYGKKGFALVPDKIEKKAFWEGFEKRAYDYSYEMKGLEKDFARRSTDTPISLKRTGLLGAGIGGVLGAVGGALKGRETGSPMLGALLGGGLGLAGGGLVGVFAAIADELGIERAKTIMKMNPQEREEYLRHLARQNEISEQQRREWSRHLQSEQNQERRHKEMMGSMNRRT